MKKPVSVGDRKSVIDDDFSPATIKVETHYVLAVGRKDGLASVLVIRPYHVRKHLSSSSQHFRRSHQVNKPGRVLAPYEQGQRID